DFSAAGAEGDDGADEAVDEEDQAEEEDGGVGPGGKALELEGGDFAGVAGALDPFDAGVKGLVSEGGDGEGGESSAEVDQEKADDEADPDVGGEGAGLGEDLDGVLLVVGGGL